MASSPAVTIDPKSVTLDAPTIEPQQVKLDTQAIDPAQVTIDPSTVKVDGPAPKPTATAAFGNNPRADVPATRYSDNFKKAAARWGVDENWLRSIHAIEDPSDDPRALSPAGAVGEMQTLPGTFKQYADPGARSDDPDANINAGAHYFSYLLHRYKGNVDAALASYNEGEGAYDSGSRTGEGYAKQAEANYKFLSQNLGAPGASLSKGNPTKPKAVAAAKPKKTADQDQDSYLDEVDKTAQDAYNLPGDLGSTVWKGISQEERTAITNLANTGAAKTATRAAHFIGQLVDLAPETLNAYLRDAVTPGSARNLGNIGSGLVQMLSHPQHAGDVLDHLATAYGINSKEELAYWTNPNTRKLLMAAKPATPDGIQMQQVLSLHADWARFLLTHRGIMNLDTAIEEFYNPANHIPGAFLSRVAAPALRVAGRGAEHVADTVAPHKTAILKSAVTWAKTNAPMGDRFHTTKVRLGEEAAAEHHLLASKIQRAPSTVQSIFGQEHMFGGTSVPERQTIARQQDRFFNPHETTHVLQPQGGDPIMDPHTKTIATKKGGLYGVPLADHYNHVFVAHTTEPLILPKGKEAQVIFGPNADAYSSLVKKGEYSKALRMMPSITQAEADAFELKLRSDAAALPLKGRAEFVRRQMFRRTSGEMARNNGHEAVELTGSKAGNEVWHVHPQPALQRDTSLVGQVSVYDRAVNIANAVKTHFDDPIGVLTPRVAKHFVSGFLARSGAFKEEMSPTEWFQGDMTAEAMAKGGGTGLNPGGAKRVYKSIRHAEEIKPDGSPGEAMDPAWDPAASNAKAMERSLRYQQYVKFIAQKAKPIDYDEVVNNSVASGRYTPLTTLPAAFGHGQLGEKEMIAFADAEGKKMAETMPGPSFQSLTDEQRAERVDQARSSVLRTLQEQFAIDNPNKVFRLDEKSGVSDFAGSTVHQAHLNAAMDSHPAFESGGPGIGDKKWMGTDPPENKFADGFESIIHMMRTIFMIDPTYHQRENLSTLLFAVGKLNPLEVTQILTMPHSIDPALLRRAEEYGATSVRNRAGVIGRNTHARSAYATPHKDVETNLAKRQMDLPERLRTVLAGYKNVAKGSNSKGAAAVHILAHTAYTADKWNQDLTFGVWEDVSSAVLFGKLEKSLGSPTLAARETRRILGDTVNMTTLERKIGLQRLEWYYSWMKGQMKLWSRKAVDPRVLGTNNAVQDTVSTNNQQSDVSNPDQYTQKGQAVFYVGDKPYAMTMQPPPLKKLMAINSIIGAPFTAGEGFIDFAKYMTSVAAYDANPLIKTAMQSDQVFGGGGGEDDAGKQTVGELAAGGAANLGQAFIPPQAKAIRDGAGDHVRYLELLGVPVINIDDKAAGIGPAIEVKRIEKLRDNLLRAATSERGRTNIKNYYEPIIQRLQQQAAQARGQ